MNQSDSNKLNVAFTAINSIAVIVCLLAAILVFALKLHKKVVYRLALYQVLASLSFATVETLQVMFINYDNLEESEVYGHLCTAIGWLSIYTRWVKLLFTMWVTVHLFCFGVLRKNLDKFEALYVVTSLLVPAPMAAIPAITNNYTRSPFHSYCYIYNSSGSDQATELVERLTLWDVPAICILIASTVAMGLLVIKILRAKLLMEPIIGGKWFWKALKELLPLAAFPVLFFIFIVPSLVFHIYAAVNPKAADRNSKLLIPAIVCISLWSLSSGAILILHLSLATCVVHKAGWTLRRGSYTELHDASSKSVS